MFPNARSLLALAAALACQPCNAEGLLGKLRDVDLNDYALGVAFSASQNPYIGAGNNVYLYPYLTTFQHPALTNGIVTITDGNFGLRYVTDSQWEFGVLGRIQTRGPGAADGDDRPVLEDRDWVVEAGPLLGWRGWPVHLQLRSYWEAPNRHDGFTTELEFSLPIDHSRGFFVPYVRMTHFSDDYSNYYFGVSERESTPTLPQYAPGEVSQLKAGFKLGYELSPRWLLSTSLAVEFLDEAVRDSPIIDRDHQWSGTVGLAYNASLFQTRERRGDLASRGLELRASITNSSLDTDVTRTPSPGAQAQTVNAEDALNVSDEESVFQFDARVRLGYYHRLELTAFELERSSSTELNQDVTFGGREFPAGSSLNTQLDISLIRTAYSYSLMRDEQKELSLAVGLSFVNFNAGITDSEVPGEESLNLDATLPTLGARGSVTLGEHWTVEADAFVFAMEFDRYDGVMSQVSLGVDRRFGSTVRVGLGLDYFRLALDAADERADENLTLTQFGPKLYVSANF
ncbi:MAG: MipA/OmpV family protein [Pseudomonadota bacterium]